MANALFCPLSVVTYPVNALTRSMVPLLAEIFPFAGEFRSQDRKVPEIPATGSEAEKAFSSVGSPLIRNNNPAKKAGVTVLRGDNPLPSSK